METILSGIKQVEGPVSYFLLYPTNKLNKILGRKAPPILMFGDIHSGRNKCDKCEVKDGCYSFYEKDNIIPFMKYLNEKQIKYIDVYLEQWLSKTFREEEKLSITKTPIKQNSAIIDTVLNLLPCFSKGIQHCPYPNLRVHMVDVRASIEDDKYLGDAVLEQYKNYVIENKNYERFIEYIKTTFPDENILNIFKLLNNYSMTEYVQEPFYRKHSRMVHELNQLPPELQKQLIETVPTSKYSQHLLKIVEFNMNVVDIYTISRILKTIQSKLAVVYMGNDHILNIKEILIKLSLYKVKKEYNQFEYKEGFYFETQKQYELFNKKLENTPKCLNFN